MTTHTDPLKCIIEGALLAAGEPCDIQRLLQLFDEGTKPSVDDIRAVLLALEVDYAERGIELKELASGYVIQVKAHLSPWIAKIWQEKPPRYSRALLETLALIAYRQPITRAEIETIRGVAVSTSIIKTLQDREWIRIVGYRETPGKPALYATTRYFLDYFNLKSLEELPTLVEIDRLEEIVSSPQERELIPVDSRLRGDDSKLLGNDSELFGDDNQMG